VFHSFSAAVMAAIHAVEESLVDAEATRARRGAHALRVT